MQNLTQRPFLIIVLIWLFLTALNINKPFHSDDGFHLEAAAHIAKEQLKPMSGLVRWDQNEPEPIYKANQPPFLFYLIAAVGSLFGFGEIPMHLLLSVFTFLVLFWFYKTSQIVGSKKPLLLTTFLAFCPALVVNQNIMTDIPVLAFLLGTYYFWLVAEKTGNRKYLIFSMILLTLGLFTKYIFLPILMAMAIILIFRKQYHYLKYLLIPVSFIVLWSCWNYWEFGGIHLLGRSAKPKFSRLEMLWSYFSCMGCLVAFSLILFEHFSKKGLKQTNVFKLSGILFMSVLIIYFLPIRFEKYITHTLEILFVLNGLFIIYFLKKFASKSIKQSKTSAFLQTDNGSALILIICISMFTILFAPFIAPRHLLLIIPFILLLASEAVAKSSKAVTIFSLTVSFLLSTLLAISDWKYADFYRKTAIEIGEKMPGNARVWATGTGGWQWYARQNKMHQYILNYSDVQTGDYILVAKGLPHYRIDNNLKYTHLGKMVQSQDPFTFFSVNRGFSMYHTNFGLPSWTLSKQSTDTIYVLLCVGKETDTDPPSK
ncbi:MAG TPA: glycosyltransferase family 39 protein [Niabella sp.]|nr:glycosyltransferase family 39 protein [Niabella sp.]HOZ97529.1 glycosyltransferase family 39 protein [Niabella sp.]HQW15617.1 glycosyltransferase family 39 protein [Niabella sp.]HQX20760.1 glycosyltransferase family 39 protein [Niabella sp.]HQX41359.1 glycosyltransferase family 39 protein [Niabella sp.]